MAKLSCALPGPQHSAGKSATSVRYMSAFNNDVNQVRQTASFAMTPEKENDLQKLMELLDVSAMPEQMAEMMITNIINQEKNRMPNMPKNVESAISNIIRNVTLKHGPELFKMVSPLYDKYYTHSEIKELIKFFSSPIGRKYNAVLQPMMNDIIPIAQQWGRKIGPIAAQEVVKELEKMGYK